ncbi:hypothetical protein FSARC_10691 [Fusarium sarcochroum]|uniref:Ketoreductase domain-containing protein n=1 Tax=Fusarium sarcochroum TaxID=1208366 RepID=A0A8H4TKD3_9HYPO|nr:hypothetical protein FSARC_10691 [Fusarium sarcochroum]
MPRVWLITGSSRGLGLALTRKVLDLGDIVIATSRKSVDLQHFVDRYGSQQVKILDLDVSNAEQVDHVFTSSMETFGRIDVVVNNAGYADECSIEDTPLDSFRAQIDTNFLGAVYVTKAVLPIMRKQGSGRILQISSLGGRVGSPGLGAYQSAKWAINGFTTVLAREVAPLGIRVTSCEPGGIKTDWAGSSMGKPPVNEYYQRSVGATRIARQKAIAEAGSEPEDIARAIVHISQVDDPPVRLLLGFDTPKYAQKAAEDLAMTDEKWQHVTNLSF